MFYASGALFFSVHLSIRPLHLYYEHSEECRPDWSTWQASTPRASVFRHVYVGGSEQSRVHKRTVRARRSQAIYW